MSAPPDFVHVRALAFVPGECEPRVSTWCLWPNGVGDDPLPVVEEWSPDANEWLTLANLLATAPTGSTHLVRQWLCIALIEAACHALRTDLCDDGVTAPVPLLLAPGPWAPHRAPVARHADLVPCWN